MYQTGTCCHQCEKAGEEGRQLNNEEYFELLNNEKKTLDELRKQGVELAQGVIGKTLFGDDLFFCASLNRCINLIDGFWLLLNNRNLTCGAILRLQIDNCLRTYAAFIAADRNKVIECIINGKRIDKERDTQGHMMTDGYLKKKLGEMDSSIVVIYDNTSGYVHLSEKAFYETVVNCDNGEVEFQIGRELPEKRNSVLIEMLEAFIHFIKLHYKMVTAVVDSKRRYDLENSDF